MRNVLRDEKPEFNLNGRAVDVVKVDFDSSIASFVLTHPDGSMSEVSLVTGTMKPRSSERRI